MLFVLSRITLRDDANGSVEIQSVKDIQLPVKSREANESRESVNIVEVHEPPRAFASDATSQKSTPPPPPPPPPLQTQKSTSSTYSNNTGTSKSNKSYGGTSNHDQVQEELKYVLTMFRDKKRNPDAMESQEVFLDEYSSPREVQRWLAVKGFSEKVSKQLKDMTGSDVFGLSRKQLEQYFGTTEGGRLVGQITLARNECGYKGTRSSELKQILEKARRKAEVIDDQDETWS